MTLAHPAPGSGSGSGQAQAVVNILGTGGGASSSNHGAVLYAIKNIGGTAVTSATSGFTARGGAPTNSKDTFGNFFVAP